MDDYNYATDPTYEGNQVSLHWISGSKFFIFRSKDFPTCEVRTIGPALTLALAAASIFYDELRGDEKFETWECFFFFGVGFKGKRWNLPRFCKERGVVGLYHKIVIFLVGVQEGNA